MSSEHLIKKSFRPDRALIHVFTLSPMIVMTWLR